MLIPDNCLLGPTDWRPVVRVFDEPGKGSLVEPGAQDLSLGMSRRAFLGRGRSILNGVAAQKWGIARERDSMKDNESIHYIINPRQEQDKRGLHNRTNGTDKSKSGGRAAERNSRLHPSRKKDLACGEEGNGDREVLMDIKIQDIFTNRRAFSH